MDITNTNITNALSYRAQANVTGAADDLKAAIDERQLEKIDAAAKDFEAVFIAEMMKPMFEGTEADAPFNGGRGEEVFRGLMIQEYGKTIAERGGFGLADSVKEAMIEIQAKANLANSTQTNGEQDAAQSADTTIQ